MNAADIRPFLTTKMFGRKIFAHDTIGSTNLEAKKLFHEGAEEGTIIIADDQTAGIGRMNRRWVSEPQKNLTFSVILRPGVIPERLGIISLYASLAVAEAVEMEIQCPTICKWPNDVLLNGKKFCGILSEGVIQGSRVGGVIIGIGININQVNFPEPLEQTATSLCKETGIEYPRYQVLASVLSAMEKRYGDLERRGGKAILEGWERRTSMFGKQVVIDNQGVPTEGIAKRLDDDGGLIIDGINGEVKILAGDVILCSSR